MTQAPLSAEQLTAAQRSLTDFDFAFNGVLDPVLVREIATAAFVGRGENLLLVGGCATGKTVIANAVCDQAKAIGMTSECLRRFDPEYSHSELLAYSDGLVGVSAVKQALRQELLDCDVLLVDEVEWWLRAAPKSFLILLGRRIELGKSNILAAHSASWKRLCSGEFYTCHQSAPVFEQPMYLLGTKPEQRSQWGMMMVRECYLSVPYLLKVLGLEFILPGMEGQVPAGLSAVRPASGADLGSDPSPFATTPVWHKLYTGERSYVDVLLRRA